MTEIDTLRPVAAGRLLAIRRKITELESDEAVRGLLCNAEVLSQCCYFGEKPAFGDGAAVLAALTMREMEELLRRLSNAPTGYAQTNPEFEEAQFDALRGE